MQEWAQILLKSIALFIVVWAAVRLMGKRNMSQISPFNFVSYLIIAIVASLISISLINLFYGFITLIVWIAFPIALDYLAIKSRLMHQLINGKEAVLIKHGKIMEDNLMRARMTGEDLLAHLRSKNAFNLADVEFAVMETNGTINPYLKSDRKPVTSYDLGNKVAPQAEPQTVVLDGNMLEEPLASLGLNPQWLSTELDKMGISLENVFLGQVDSSGDLYLDLFDDAVQIPQPKVKEMLYATLEKIQADLVTFALQTEDTEARAMYSKDSHKLEELLKKLRPYLLR
jgi:Predicted membrane protein